MKNMITYQFEGWIQIDLPETWGYEQEDDILNIYANIRPKGVLQISFYRIDLEENREDIVSHFLDKFINKFDIEVDINTKMVLERDDYTIATTEGMQGGRFVKVWYVVEEKRMLLFTYNADKKTREVSTIEDIVYGTIFI